MPKRLSCPNCRASYTTDDHGAGPPACPACGRRLRGASGGWARVEFPDGPPAPLPADRPADEPPPPPAWDRRPADVRVVRASRRGPLVAGIVGFVLLVGVVATGVSLVLANQAWKPRAPVADRSPAATISDHPIAEPPPSELDRKPPPRQEPVAPSPDPLAAEQLHPRLVRCSVLVDTAKGLGSGFVVRADDRFVVTNYHVVGRESRVEVICPLYDGSGDPITDLRRYKGHRELLIPGTVVDRDLARDLALIRADRLPDGTTAIPLARRPAPPGSVVYSVGGSGAGDNLLWRLTRGNVRGRVQRQERLEYGRLDCMVLETDAPTNKGDSGGALMNDRGELVGVVSHGSTVERQVSGNVDVEEVRAFLARHTGR